MVEDEIKYTEGFTPIPNEFRKMRFSGNVVILYLFLMSGVNEKKWGDSRTFPSWSTIKQETGIRSNETLSNAITELVEFGWIKNIVSRNDDSNIYFMAYHPEPNDTLILKRTSQKQSRSTAMKKKYEDGKSFKKVLP
jgi:hypothetical protein